MSGVIEGLTPVQQRTLDALRRSGEPVVFDADFVAELRGEVRAAVDHFAARLDADDEVWLSKHQIASVLECEQHHLHVDEFRWTSATAQGTIAHRAIELLLSWPERLGEPAPSDLVDEAMDRLSEDGRRIGQWIDTLSPADVADVRGQATARVTQFVENFPPLSKRWAPVTEASIRWPITGPITLAGKVDLQFGRPNGRESRKVLIDVKTGRPHSRHRQDLAFYALLETLVREVPPRKVATFYLDSAEAHTDDVTEPVLEAALRRTLDALERIVELRSDGRPPTRRAGTTCRWCPLNETCDDGVAYLRALAVVD